MNATDRGIHRALDRDRRKRRRQPVDGAGVRDHERIRIKRDNRLKRGAGEPNGAKEQAFYHIFKKSRDS